MTAIVMPILLRNERKEQGLRSMRSAIRWREYAADRGLRNCKVVCVCADPECTYADDLKLELGHESVAFRRKVFDTTQPLTPHARELFDEAESSIESRDLVLLLAPGSVVTDFDALANAVVELETQPYRIFVSSGATLPVAALFAASTQRARGLFLVARDGWGIRMRRSFFGHIRYERSDDPFGSSIVYDVPWLIGALACAVEERGRGTLRLEIVNWAA